MGQKCQGFAWRNGFCVRHVLGNSSFRKSQGRETAVLGVRFDVLTNNVSSRHKGEREEGLGFTEETLREEAFSRRKSLEDERETVILWHVDQI